jgi:transcriptional regulator with XRE-family HTH domain
MMTAAQCRAARAWLSWSQDELARRAGVSVSTVKDFERGERSPIQNNLAAMRRALEAAGVSMVFDGEEKAAGIGWTDPGKPT